MVSKFYFFAGFAVFLGGFFLGAFCDALGVPSLVPELVIVAAIFGCIVQPFRMQDRQDRAIAFTLFGFVGFLLALFDLALQAKFVATASQAWFIIGVLGAMGMLVGGLKQEEEATNY